MNEIDADQLSPWLKKAVKEGDIFAGNHEALVVPTNLKGKHGALAGEFAKRFPTPCKLYTKLCEDATEKNPMVFGDVICFETGLNRPKYLFFVPTTPDSGMPSHIGFIVAALPNIANLIKVKKIKNIGIPAIGCGVGKLDFQEVACCIEDWLSEGLDCNVSIYAPQ